MSEAWSQWQGQVIDSKFHLKQYLGGSRHSGVFLAQLSNDAARGQSTDTRFAIRLIADSPNPELQLSRWRMAQDVAHPHLLRILETGRCHLGLIDLIYVVMEYGEENLGQIVPQRPLTAQEAHEMLEPALDAVTYLHSRGMVHGHLKPANIMAVNDQLKLAADGICPADQPVLPSALDAAHDVYDAPETSEGSWSPTADVWSLGMTLAEVLTQHLPSSNGDPDSDPLLPANIPVEFVEIVRGCLRRDLRLRWNIQAIESRLQNLTAAQPATAEAHAGTRAGLAEPGSEVVAPAAAPTAPSTSTVPVAAPQPTFAQALHAKPVASEKPVQVPLARAVAAGAGAKSDTTMSAATVEPVIERPARKETISGSKVAIPESWTFIPDPRLAGRRATDSRQEQGSDDQNANGENHQTSARPTPFDDEKPSPIAATISRISTLRVQTLPKVQRFTSQAREVTKRTASRTRIWLQQTIERAEELLGPYPSRKLQSIGLLALVLFALAAAIYASFTFLRHKEISKATHVSTTSSPKVVIAHPQQKPAPQKRTSKPPAKPQPGTPVSRSESGSQNSTAPATPAQAQPQPAHATSPAASTQAVPQSPDGQSSVRRIDDGGAEEETETITVATRALPAKSNSNAGPVSGVQQVLPEVSQSALKTIRGTVRVSVRVRVDRSGNVADAALASAGPSRYFARKSLEAAQSWRFAPGQNAGSPLLLHFEFRNNGARAFATKVGS